jgi:type II secretory pathway pseudopilin PulG
MEVIVASGIFALCAGYALSTMSHNRRAAETTTRVGNLQQIRRLLTKVRLNLQRAVVLETPGWATAACQALYLDDEYRKTSLYGADKDNVPLTRAAMDALPDTAEVHVVLRIEEEGKDTVIKRLDRDLLIRRVRFFRLGRSMIGFRVELRGDPDASTVQLKKGEVYSQVVTLNRQVH